MQMIILVISAVISIVFCLFGIKLLRVCNGLAGVVTGLGLGYIVTRFIAVEPKVQWGIMVAAAIILGILAVALKRFGVFLFCAVGVTGMLMFLVQPENALFYAVFGGVGMLFAIAAMQWLDAIYILATSFVGGVGIGHIILEYIPKSSFIIQILVYAIPVLLGCAVQFILKSREIGRKEAKFAKEMKKETSMEEEVEQARSLIENDLISAMKTEENSQEDS